MKSFNVVLTVLMVFAVSTAQAAPQMPKAAADSNADNYKAAAANAKVRNGGKKTAAKPVPAAAPASAASGASTVVPEVKADEGAQAAPKEDQVRAEGTTSAGDIDKLEYKVKLDNKGEYYVEAKDAGCSTCASIKKPLNFKVNDLDHTGTEEAQLKATATEILKKALQDNKVAAATAKPKLSTKELAMKKKMDNCEVANMEGERFESDEDQVACFETKINDLLASKKVADNDKAKGLLESMAKLYEKDVLGGKADSAFVKYFKNIAENGTDNDSSFADKAKFNFAITTQALIAEKVYVNTRNVIDARIKSIQALADAGYIQQATQQANALRSTYSTVMKNLADSAITQVGYVSKLKNISAPGFSVADLTVKHPELKDMVVGADGQVADIVNLKMSASDLNLASEKLNTYVSSASKRGVKQVNTAQVSSKFGYSIAEVTATSTGNPAVDSAGGLTTTNGFLFSDEQLRRGDTSDVRGSVNGRIPTGIPQNPATIGLGATAVAQPLNQSGILANANTLNSTTPTNRTVLLR